MTTNRNRAAYNRALKLARDSYWAKMEQDPGFDIPWDVYRPQFITQALDNISVKPRGPRASENQTNRQRYQQVYQRARRKAMDYYNKTPKLQSQFVEFPAYWTAHKNTWLPDGFFKPKGRPLTVKRQTNAKDTRTAYRVVYNHHRRCWDGNIADCWERFKTWERYWTYVKANGFVPGEQREDIPNIVVHEEHGIPALSRIPESWMAKPAPITRPCMTVSLEGDPEPEPVWT